jgi:hypothetical protein
LGGASVRASGGGPRAVGREVEAVGGTLGGGISVGGVGWGPRARRAQFGGVGVGGSIGPQFPILGAHR